MDLSKPSDTVNHDLLIAKLNTYCFTEESLKFIKGYLLIADEERKLIPVLAVE